VIDVEIATSYKYLGVVTVNKLNWMENTTNVLNKKPLQRMFFFRKSYRIDHDIPQLY